MFVERQVGGSTILDPGATTAGSAGVCMIEQKKGSYLESWCELVEE